MGKMSLEKAAQRLSKIWAEIGEIREQIDFKQLPEGIQVGDVEELFDKAEISLDTLACRLRGDKS